MDKKTAYDKITHYLKSHFIKYYTDIYENTERIIMAYNGYSNCPDNTIESCIFFHSSCMECRVYYTSLGAEICRNSSCQTELFRLFNYINAMVWPSDQYFLAQIIDKILSERNDVGENN